VIRPEGLETEPERIADAGGVAQAGTRRSLPRARSSGPTRTRASLELFGSFLKCVLVTKSAVRNFGANTIEVTTSHSSPLGPGKRS
jgi:hypothetical protein